MIDYLPIKIKKMPQDWGKLESWAGPFSSMLRIRG